MHAKQNETNCKQCMKFDYIIMNPPYNGNLHLQILDKVLQCRKDTGVLVNLSPARWFEDPLAIYKEKRADFNKYRHVWEQVSDFHLIDSITGTKLFQNIALTSDLALLKFDGSRMDDKSFVSPIA